MRVLVTGADGFVGRYLCRTLAEAGHVVVAAASPSAPGGLELTDSSSVLSTLQTVRPDAIVNLAGISSIAESHRTPSRTFEVNALGTMHLLEGARKACPKARILIVGSGDAYGRLAPGASATESDPTMPLSPYATSKVAAETAALQFHRSYGTDVVCARPYNHLGRGQAAHFVVPSFAAQIAAIRAGTAEPVLQTGDLTPIRDFSHVLDVVLAYELLLRAGVSGGIYNIASGSGRSIRSLLDEMLSLAKVTARVEVDPERIRPIEIPSMIGNPARLHALGWAPRLTVRTALREVLDEHGALDHPE